MGNDKQGDEVMAKVKIKRAEKKEPEKTPTLQERWASDGVPFRVYRNGEWVNAGDLKKQK